MNFLTKDYKNFILLFCSYVLISLTMFYSKQEFLYIINKFNYVLFYTRIFIANNIIKLKYNYRLNLYNFSILHFKPMHLKVARIRQIKNDKIFINKIIIQLKIIHSCII